MAQFGQIASPFANVLFDPIGVSMAADRTQRNRLMAEEHGQDRETEQVGRVSASLMSLPAAARPAAYAEARREMQSRGMAMRAPEQYPGDQQIEQMARAAMPAATQFALAEKQRASEAMMGMIQGLTGMGGAGVPAGGGGGPQASATVPPDMLPHFQAASARTGIPVPVLTAQAQQESGFRPDAVGRAGEVGVMQVLPTTARQPGFGMAGVDPASLRDPATNIQFGADYLRARGGAGADFTDPAQRDRALTAYNGGGDPNYAANVTRNMPGGAQPAAAGGYTPEDRLALITASQQGPGAFSSAVMQIQARQRADADRVRTEGRSDERQAQSMELQRAAAERAERGQAQSIEAQRQSADRADAAARRADETARRVGATAGLPQGYQRNAAGVVEPIPGLPDATPRAPANAIGGMQENVTSLRKVDDALDALEKSGAGIGVRGYVPGPILNRTDPAGVSLRALIADIGSLKLHDRSGAAVTASESPRLIPFIPLITDDPQTAKTKLENFRNEYQATLRDQYQINGPAGGFRALPPIEEALRRTSARQPLDAAAAAGADSLDGRTITNGATGQQMIRRGGKWEPL